MHLPLHDASLHDVTVLRNVCQNCRSSLDFLTLSVSSVLMITTAEVSTDANKATRKHRCFFANMIKNAKAEPSLIHV